MKFFDVIPSELFSPLASPNRALYADALDVLYRKYGWYGEKTYNLVMPGLDGLEKMANLMKSLRQNPPAVISGVAVARRKDYTDGSVWIAPPARCPKWS